MKARLIKFLILVYFLYITLSGCGSDSGGGFDSIETVQTCDIYTDINGTTTEYCSTYVSKHKPYITEDGSIARDITE